MSGRSSAKARAKTAGVCNSWRGLANPENVGAVCIRFPKFLEDEYCEILGRTPNNADIETISGMFINSDGNGPGGEG